jgi:hypothetical protein
MTGKEMAKRLWAHKGKVEVPMLTPEDVVHVFVEKTDLATYFHDLGDRECGMTVEESVRNGKPVLRLDTDK